MKPVVVIPVKNRLDLTRPLVRSLMRQGGYEKLLVYDNGSTDGTREWLDIQLLFWVDAEGKSLHEMWNDAIDRAEGRHVVFLNNDLELDDKPNWLRSLCEPLDLGWAAVCPNYDGRTDYRAVLPLKGVAAGREDGTGGLAGFAFAVRGDVLQDYRFPEEAKWWFGDTDLVYTLNEREEQYGMVMNCGVTHIGGGSQTSKQEDISEQVQKDREWFEKKWGVVCTAP